MARLKERRNVLGTITNAFGELVLEVGQSLQWNTMGMERFTAEFRVRAALLVESSQADVGSISIEEVRRCQI